MPPRAAHRARPRGIQRPTSPEGFLGRVLDPIDRLSETIFSVLILLTFTMAYRVFWLRSDPYEPVPPDYLVDLFLAALGATFAWGVIDGVIYALLAVFERGEKHRFLAGVQRAGTRDEGLGAVADEFDYMLEPITGEEQRRLLYADILDHLRDSPPQPATARDADARRLVRGACLRGGSAAGGVAVAAPIGAAARLFLGRHTYVKLHLHCRVVCYRLQMGQV
jgi:hypothetical protein